MVSLTKYLLEQNMSLADLQRSRTELLRKRGFGGARQVPEPTRVNTVSPSVARENIPTGPTPTRVPGPTKIPLKDDEVAPGVTRVPSPYNEHPISGDDWVRKFGGGLRKAAETYQENR